MGIISDEIERLAIEARLNELLYIANPVAFSIEWGMNHITFSPSKRVRPLLLLESNLVFGHVDDDSYLLAAAVELIHTYSLVHDDLPCMDDDELRRGVKTLHTFRDEAYGVLAGDALLTRVFNIVSGYSKHEKLPLILRYLGEKAGYQGMIYGQMLDMEGEMQSLSVEEINKINYYKTGALLQLALLLGAINGGATEAELALMESLGRIMGMMFQIQDDILDIAGDTALLGKPVGSDAKNNKSSIPLLVGLDDARKMMQEYYDEACIMVGKLKGNQRFFDGFLQFLLTREK